MSFSLFNMQDGSHPDKRAHHNALKRRRRDHIKDSFHSLRDCIPSLVGEKVSRAQILNKATEYIRHMQKGGSTREVRVNSLFSFISSFLSPLLFTLSLSSTHHHPLSISFLFLFTIHLLFFSLLLLYPLTPSLLFLSPLPPSLFFPLPLPSSLLFLSPLPPFSSFLLSLLPYYIIWSQVQYAYFVIYY